MTCEQIYRNESSGARSKELSHDSDGSNKKKKNLLTIMASKEWLLITTVKLKIVVKSTEIHLKYAHIVTPQQGFVFALYSGFFYKKL